MKGQESNAKLIAETILEVRSGRISAKKGAEKLQMSRKSYYKWEKRALGGMLDALVQRPSGRPELPSEDPEKLAMRKELEQLKGENLKLQKQLELRIIVQKMLTDDLEDKKKEE
jgi:hypothetical protein